MLRRAMPKDVREIARIYLEAIRDTYRQILPDKYFASQTAEKAEKIWMDFLKKPDAECLVWEQKGVVTAFAGVRCKGERVMNLSSLYVDRCCRGNGIGKRMIRAVLENAETKSFEGVTISVVLQNKRAKGLYEHMGAVFQKTFTYYFDDYPVECGEYLWDLSQHTVAENT